MKYLITHPSKLSENRYHQLVRLNLGTRGRMLNCLYDMRNSPDPIDRLAICTNDNYKEVLGWAMLPTNRWLMVFVDYHCRGQGIGSHLVDILSKEGRKLYTQPLKGSRWNNTVFERFNIQNVNPYYH